jgi:predicted DNA-binding transcriptional regulator YafY
MTRAERLAATLLMLHEGAQTAGGIARRFGVSRRTVLRDIQSLWAMGVPVESRDGAAGGYRLPDGYAPAPLALDAEQTFLLLLALDALGHMADAPFGEARAALVERLRASLPREHVPGADRLLDTVRLDVPHRRQRTPHLQALTRSLQQRRWLRITYRSADTDVEHHIYPRSLYAEKGLWYCRAYALERGGERTFRVDRIRQLRQAGASYQRIAAPAPVPYDDPGYPEIVVELTARGAALLESEPHLSGSVTRDGNGSLMLRFRCPPSEWDYYVRLFGGMGGDAVVHAPPELCERLAVLARQIASIYKQ